MHTELHTRVLRSCAQRSYTIRELLVYSVYVWDFPRTTILFIGTILYLSNRKFVFILKIWTGMRCAGKYDDVYFDIMNIMHHRIPLKDCIYFRNVYFEFFFFFGNAIFCWDVSCKIAYMVHSSFWFCIQPYPCMATDSIQISWVAKTTLDAGMQVRQTSIYVRIRRMDGLTLVHCEYEILFFSPNQ